MPNPLLIANEKRATAVAYLKHFIGLPYAWGGDDPMAGFDCSGLAHEVLQAVGIEHRGYDATAHGMYFDYRNKAVDRGYAGCLVFWFKAAGTVQHISMMIDNARIIHAAGGGSNTLTIADAIRQNAYVRMDDLEEYAKYRGQEYKICDPFMVNA